MLQGGRGKGRGIVWRKGAERCSCRYPMHERSGRVRSWLRHICLETDRTCHLMKRHDQFVPCVFALCCLFFGRGIAQEEKRVPVPTLSSASGIWIGYADHK